MYITLSPANLLFPTFSRYLSLLKNKKEKNSHQIDCLFFVESLYLLKIDSFKMKRNCSSELRLLPPSDSLSSTDFATGHRHNHHQQHSTPQNQQKQLTIFYGGRVCVCDVTELQVCNLFLLSFPLF